MSISFMDVVRGRFNSMSSVSRQFGVYFEKERTFIASPFTSREIQFEHPDCMLIPQWLIKEMLFADVQLIEYQFGNLRYQSFVSAWIDMPCVIVIGSEDTYFGMRLSSMRVVSTPQQQVTVKTMFPELSSDMIAQEEVNLLG